ncbi:MAG: CpaD family pilus assembly lipoprotein [Holosporaceae bacterium]|jgi:pilus biogenesis lipoprotein CpaD|nr:CpaD family pilus assembly lipoprotein [Holosporaceae bacterium]
MLKTSWWKSSIIIVLSLLGCEKQYLPNDGYIPEKAEIMAKENKQVHFFKTSSNFNLDSADIDALERLFRDTRGEGTDNIGFMLTSDKPIPFSVRENTGKKLRRLMHKYGFINSRIVDSGTCTYQGAKTGIRIDVLKYDVKTPDCSQWSEYIGDTDTNKHLPRYGASDAYNLAEMISNKADLVSPRKYSGQDAASAISTMGKGGSSSSSTSTSSGTSK